MSIRVGERQRNESIFTSGRIFSSISESAVSMGFNFVIVGKYSFGRGTPVDRSMKPSMMEEKREENPLGPEPLQWLM